MITQIQVTVDGPREVHDRKRPLRSGKGTFDIILDNSLDLLKELPEVQLHARTNMTSENSIEELVSLYKFYEEKGLTKYPNFNYYFNPIFESFGGCRNESCVLDEWTFYQDAFRRLYEENPFPGEMNWSPNMWQNTMLQKIMNGGSQWLPSIKACGATRENTYLFGPEGLLYACMNEVGIRERAVGSWFPDWKLYDYVNIWKQRDFTKIEECNDCKYAFVCAGGCPRAVEKKHGTLYAPACDGESQERQLLHRLASFRMKEIEILEE
jgi:uncharacterized protein